MKITTNNGTRSGIEMIMKYCSDLTRMIGYSYYFNWSNPTHHQDTSPNGELSDIVCAIIRCGVYPLHPTLGRVIPVEKVIMVGEVNLIVNDHKALDILLSQFNIKISTWDDIESNIDVIKVSIDMHLSDLVIKETNRGITAYNAEVNDNLPMVYEIDLSSITDKQSDMIKMLTKSCRKQLENSGVSESDIDNIISNGIS